MIEIPLNEYFGYHPAITDTRKQSHTLINESALNFAQILNNLIVDEDCKKMAMFAIQQARMFANQGVTIDELRGLNK